MLNTIILSCPKKLLLDILLDLLGLTFEFKIRFLICLIFLGKFDQLSSNEVEVTLDLKITENV